MDDSKQKKDEGEYLDYSTKNKSIRGKPDITAGGIGCLILLIIFIGLAIFGLYQIGVEQVEESKQWDLQWEAREEERKIDRMLDEIEEVEERRAINRYRKYKD